MRHAVLPKSEANTGPFAAESPRTGGARWNPRFARSARSARRGIPLVTVTVCFSTFLFAPTGTGRNFMPQSPGSIEAVKPIPPGAATQSEVLRALQPPVTPAPTSVPDPIEAEVIVEADEPIQPVMAIRWEAATPPRPVPQWDLSLPEVPSASANPNSISTRQNLASETGPDSERPLVLSVPKESLLQRPTDGPTSFSLTHKVVRSGNHVRTAADVQIGYGSLFFDEPYVDEAAGRVSRNAPSCPYLQVSFDF